MAVFAFLNDDRHSKTADVHRDSHGFTPFREVWPTACRVVQRLAAEAAYLQYPISTRRASPAKGLRACFFAPPPQQTTQNRLNIPLPIAFLRGFAIIGLLP